MMKWPQARSITRCASRRRKRAANISGLRGTASGVSLTGTQYPPLGQRFRLKASFIIDNSFSPHAQVILRALKKYGMILADNGSSWYISGAPDERWDNDVLHELDVVHGSDFEAVDESALMVNANSGQALSDFTVSANPIGRAIDAGDVATYQLRFEKSAAFNTSTIAITASSPSPSLTLKVSHAIITPPITITLTITDTHPIGSPPIAYTIPITATGGSVTHYASVSVLVNGLKVFLGRADVIGHDCARWTRTT